MKKLLLTLVVVLMAQLGMAQASDAFKKDVKKLLEMNGSTAQIDVAKKQVLSMVPAEKQAEFIKEFDATIPSYMDAVESFYLTEYTQDEVKQMIKFYETPVGKKLTAKAGLMMEKTLEAGQQWSMALQGLLMKYMQ